MFTFYGVGLYICVYVNRDDFWMFYYSRDVVVEHAPSIVPK